MLESTYIHCPGIGPKTEQRIWEAGALTWADYTALGDTLGLSARLRSALDPLVDESVAHLACRDFGWFARALPPREHWRAFTSFRDRIAYLDIETTGALDSGSLTVVGMYDGYRLRQFVRGDNLDAFPDAIADRSLLVTFFGTGFDLPFLENAFGMQFPQLHVDLCFLLKRLGYSGGLKKVETAFGIQRSPQTRGLDGWDAVRLWWEYRAGRESSLQTLLAYNAEDVLNLETLMNAAYPRMLARHGFASPA